MNPLENRDICCPYCGETIEILVDCSIGQQQYVEDCAVCCQPILLQVQLTDSGPVLTALAENS